MISSNLMRPMGLVALGGLLASVNARALVERQVTTCSALHVMIAGGCAMPCEADYEGLLGSLVDKVTTAFPGSDKYLVPYDGSMVQGAISSSIMKQAANAYAAACPNTPIVFLGYSLGGIIVMNTVCGALSAQASANVLAAVAYGEETFTYPESYNAGTCTVSAPLYPRGDTAACAPLAPAIKSYCDANDPKCCATGTVNSAHFVYPSSYDQLALEFIQGRAADFSIGGNTTTPVEPTSTSMPSMPITTTAVEPTPTSMPSMPTVYYPANSTIPGLSSTGLPTGPASTGPVTTDTTSVVATETTSLETTKTVTISSVFTTPVFLTNGMIPSSLIPISNIIETSGAPTTGLTTNSLSTVTLTQTRTNSIGNTVTMTLTSSPGLVGTGLPPPVSPTTMDLISSTGLVGTGLPTPVSPTTMDLTSSTDLVGTGLPSPVSPTTMAPFNNAGMASSPVPVFFKWAATLAGFLALV